MKTSELIKKINDLGNCVSVELVDGIASAFTDNKQTLICQVDDDIISTFKDRFAINSPISNAIELMFEYAKTPLEEREEEKKYWLAIPKQIKGFEYEAILNFINYDEENPYYAFCTKKEIIHNGNVKLYQTQFTQKEIDAMPFDTNFFIKEEVNE